MKSLLNFVFKGDIKPEVAEAIHMRCGGHARDAIKIAQVVVKSGIYDDLQLNMQFGLSFQQAAAMFAQVISGQSTKAEVLPSIMSLESNRNSGELFDSWVDHYSGAGHPVFVSKYMEFLQIRVWRKEYKIGVKEQLLHMFAQL
jgi:hypothetical protein